MESKSFKYKGLIVDIDHFAFFGFFEVLLCRMIICMILNCWFFIFMIFY
ncbi:hypothetical protein B194_1401 [Serratia plymuthica A30]|uniref:Uncharacterized protein n=1 Tax=Serratia plymuthica S13 TaxID=1348660 RepID=S4YRB6_SERPL|nr:hypothetical protein M621_07125 [Serratia plymuthica S13]EKF65498.1 hypothetical protein B194_1401 [Serratia plymuthica A30]